MTPVNVVKNNLRVWSILLVLSCSAVWAEDEREFTPRVARISYLEGPVTIQRTVDEDWQEATLNVPLMVGDKIYTGVGGRVELQLDDETDIRLDSDSYIHFANLEDTLTRIGISKGTVAVFANKVSYKRAPIEVKTDSFLGQINDWGKIRFNTRPDGVTEILARRGESLVIIGDQPYQLQRGDQLKVISGPPAAAHFEKINQEDAFDQWCDMRDAMQEASASRQYVNSRIAGYSDLDRYGSWVEIPDYGRVWRPTVTVVDWAPYRDGRWVWYDSCGWTWVSYEPWGWAPYHYGRWVYVRNYNWCWVPHHEVVHVVHHYPRPVWYPALVSFTYARHGRYFGFSLGGGFYDGPCIGWFALGPHDPFHPWHHRYSHHRGRTIVENNVYIDKSVHIDNSTHIYENQRAPRAVTVVSEREFTTGTYENRTAVELDDTHTRTGEVAVGSPAIQQMEQKRILETRPSREAAPSGNAPAGEGKVAAQSDSNRGVSPQRVEQPDRAVSAERGTASGRETRTAAVNPDSPRAQTGEARRDAGGRAEAAPQAGANTTRNAGGTAPSAERSTSPSRETSPIRSSDDPTAVRNTPEAAPRSSVIQDRPDAITNEAARANTSAARSDSSVRTPRAPIVNPNRDESASSARTTSPQRSSASGTNPSLERGPVIQERPGSATTKPARSLTNPARESKSSSSMRPSSLNTGSGTGSSPIRSYSQPRNSVPDSGNVRNSAISQPRTYTPPSNTQTYTPSRSYSAPRTYSPPSESRTYSAPQNYSAPPSYSAPRSNSAPQSYSAPSSRGSAAASQPSRSSGGTSSGRTSPPR